MDLEGVIDAAINEGYYTGDGKRVMLLIDDLVKRGLVSHYANDRVQQRVLDYERQQAEAHNRTAEAVYDYRMERRGAADPDPRPQARIQAVDSVTGEPIDLSVVEQAGVAFDPGAQHLDLSKEEKRRTTAIMLAVQGYRELIIKDADYLREVNAEARRGGPTIQPATIDSMVLAAYKFDRFIAGEPPQVTTDEAEPSERGAQDQEQTNG